jgi:small subunit ribosomal protein S21
LSGLFAYSLDIAGVSGTPLHWQRVTLKGGRMTLRMRVHDKEPIGLALRRFKKLIERSGMQKELRAHQHYEKPSELRRRARLRKEKAARKAREKTP